MFRCIGASCRIVDDPIESVREQHRHGKRVIFALWHEFSVVGIYWYRHRGSSALVDHAWRGDVLAGVLNHFGFQDFRISSFDSRPRQSARGVLGFVRYLREGHDGTIAMDGPIGPAREPKPGVIHIAAKSGAVILPAGAYFSHSITVPGRWDNFQIPLPFSRVHIVFDDPIEIPRDVRGREQEFLALIKSATSRATERARRRGRRYPIARREGDQARTRARAA